MYKKLTTKELVGYLQKFGMTNIDLNAIQDNASFQNADETLHISTVNGTIKAGLFTYVYDPSIIKNADLKSAYELIVYFNYSALYEPLKNYKFYGDFLPHLIQIAKAVDMRQFTSDIDWRHVKPKEKLYLAQLSAAEYLVFNIIRHSNETFSGPEYIKAELKDVFNYEIKPTYLTQTILRINKKFPNLIEINKELPWIRYKVNL